MTAKQNDQTLAEIKALQMEMEVELDVFLCARMVAVNSWIERLKFIANTLEKKP